MSTTGGRNDAGTEQLPPEIDTSVPQSARVYDYLLGGKDNFPPTVASATRSSNGSRPSGPRCVSSGRSWPAPCAT
jgi:hypothetical protein